MTNQISDTKNVSSNLMSVSRLGFWSAILTAVLAATSLGFGVVTPARGGPLQNAPAVLYPYTDGIASFIPGDYLYQIPAFLLVIVLVVLMACIHHHTVEKRVFTLIGLSFAIICATVFAIDYFIQWTVVIPSIIDKQADGLSLFSQYNPHGIFVALESIGFLMMSIALLFSAAAFSNGRLERTIRWLFIASFVLTTASFIALSFLRYDIVAFEIAAVSIDWIVLTVSGVLLSILFKRNSRFGLLKSAKN